MALPLAPQPIEAVARELGLSPDHVTPYGRGKAKVDLAALGDEAPGHGKGRLILMTAINPTPAGEGKTTTSVGLAMGLRRLGKKVALCLREPSLGPVFGVKGGGTGGGKAQLVPADDINLHFTGDIHAITSAHNLLSAMIDNALHFKTTALDPRRVRWGRALDMNDRSLRECLVGLGGPTGGVPRAERFDITAASEVMAILALAKDHADLERRLARIVVGDTADKVAVTAGDLGAAGAMAALLRDALEPNLVQTAEGGPALVHAGPFGNIAHGCNSVVATRLGLKHGDYVVTEAGFGLDLGGEKFLDIKCREMGVFPRCAVVVATLRALKLHGGAPLSRVAEPDEAALLKGLDHLDKHLATLAETYGLPAIVAINVFPTDTAKEIDLVAEKSRERGARTVRCDGFAKAGEGALELAQVVAEVADGTDASPPPARFAYALEDSLEDKLTHVAQKVYGARDVVLAGTAAKDIARIRELGYGALPVCMAKTQLSLSDDATKPGRPRDFTVTVRGVRLSAGAGFAVALTGEIMTMPGLPREPAAKRVRILENGKIVGLMQNE